VKLAVSRAHSKPVTATLSVPVNEKVILFDEVLAPSGTALPLPSVAEAMDVSGGIVSEAA
jgi:hypothetical protein